MNQNSKPIVLITGSAGNLGQVLTNALKKHYKIIGCDRPGSKCDIEMDLSSQASVNLALKKIQDKHGKKIAGVIHLAAYFDFTGEPSPLYENVNIEGTRHLMDGLIGFDIERFIYSSTMLVHAPGEVGDQINEDTPIAPKWPYPESKAKAEAIIKNHESNMPYAILRLAGVYGDDFAVPTLAEQVARIYEKDLKSIFYSGDTQAGQAFIHIDDVIELFVKTLEKRNDLPPQTELLAGEATAVSYETLQNEIGRLIHGEQTWQTLVVPKPIAKAGAWLETKSEPVIPDDLDKGEKPFIRPFMIDMASDHYALDTSAVGRQLEWTPAHSIKDTLPKLVESLKKNPLAWYKRNQVTPPDWMESAAQKKKNPHKLREDYNQHYKKAHADNIWAPFIALGLAPWLLLAPSSLGYESQAMVLSDTISACLAFVFAALSLSSGVVGRLSRWGLGAVGLWLASAPLIFWAPTAAAYLNGTLLGTAFMGLALGARPFPHESPVAAMTGPNTPPGWSFSPSDWFQRLPIIGLAVIGFVISRYMAAYQLEHIDSVWEPFFPGKESDPQNGTEEIITSSVSKAWPVPDAGLGALTYLLEIITGVIGSRNRWRTMPWLVLLFGFMIVPLGAISITFIIIQPIVIGTWCTLCLIAAAAMLLQIPYSFDEIVATIDFLKRRAKAGRPWMLILFTGDTDDGEVKRNEAVDRFDQSPWAVIKEVFVGGVSCPWNLLACCAIGIWLMCTRLTLGTEGTMASSDHLIGALVLTVCVTAFAEVTRVVRYLNVLLGLALLVSPFIFEAGLLSAISSVVCALALIGLSFPRGKITNTYGQWSPFTKI